MGEFSILSLNTFGTPLYLGWGRLRRLARQLDCLPDMVICLQEVQQNAYLPMIQRGLTSYPYSIYERHLYAPKGGLAIFSRLPVVQHRFEVYQDMGTWHSISFPDWATYKGILSVNLEIERLPIIVLNTHLNANYYGVWQRANPLAQIEHRQVQQLNQAIRSLPNDALVIVCGDFNFPRNSFLYEELVAQNDLLDPLINDQRPSYRPFPLVPSKWKTSLDYMLVRQPAQKNCQVKSDLVEIADSEKRLPMQRFLTDHNALTLQIKWEPVNPKSKHAAQSEEKNERT
jgi:endonuclease/exonuclease/phosphatase family metal-dependent hydrolase